MESSVVICSNQGILEKLACADAKNHIFRLCESKDINALRKTSMAFSKAFSFCNPSLYFIACNNKNIHKKDVRGIFLTALYDGNWEIAHCLINNYAIKHTYRIPGTHYVLSGHEIVESSCNKKMLSLQDRLKKMAVTDDAFLSRYPANSLLISCISRNNERLKSILHVPWNDSPIKLTDVMILLTMNIVIGHANCPAISMLLGNCQVREYVKHNGIKLLSHAINCGYTKPCEQLLTSNLFNVNKNITFTQTLVGNHAYEEEIVEFLDDAPTVETFTLLDYFRGEKYVYEKSFGPEFVTQIEQMLIQNGAKTTKELLCDQIIGDFILVT